MRFQKVSFYDLARDEAEFAIVKKDTEEITGGNVFTKLFFERHAAAVSILKEYDLWPNNCVKERRNWCCT